MVLVAEDEESIALRRPRPRNVPGLFIVRCEVLLLPSLHVEEEKVVVVSA